MTTLILVTFLVCSCFAEEYYQIRSSPGGGYQVNKLNSGDPNVQVDFLDFGNDYFDGTQLSDTETIVYGTLDSNHFQITGVHRMLPIDRPSDYNRETHYLFFEEDEEEDYYYTKVNIDSPAIKVGRMNNHFLNYPMIDRSWLDNKLYQTSKPFKAIARAEIRDGRVEVRAVFVSLMDPISSPCAPVHDECYDGRVITYYRDHERCVHFDQCVYPAERCSNRVPRCYDGYKLVSIPSGRRGCPRYICDPEFLPQTI
ncbi:hypothetical protein SAMD00019534_051310 [Acytostelium subglobosum LB1]|uniref:hypothetical protein n=1 Tax=Acytostelium subglobosum LB1 TaxID=1410327 RepID=UPI000644B536|nr:hypothetical protein SAMD00019534_051310 [Acytostelium subglobosum LB1]GAM21956.1 hypothetical protein SAMD00019534_051310 [Acytostelium subglobosum LB1]|eukprot:XP_012755056.1 hypothetical protein SAMD00019534_051310 [Acytostelium subglobosum LB1]